MDSFFNVISIQEAVGLAGRFETVGTETVALEDACGRVLAADVRADLDIPGFDRATMDGYAVKAAATFGASESSPAFLTVVGEVRMGKAADVAVGPGQAVRIATGAMLPPGADAVVMIEHTERLDDTAIEVYKSVAPGQHVIEAGEDVACGQVVLAAGRRIRPQEAGILAAAGCRQVEVFRKPKVGIVSTGDELVAADQVPGPGQVRDINSYSLAGQVQENGALPVAFGIAGDDPQDLEEKCRRALEAIDMLLISGGSSVGNRDFTIQVLESLPQSRILVHGISISPGKPTILATCAGKPVWGLPGHAVSAMVVMTAVVRPFIDRLAGLERTRYLEPTVPARLTRNLASAQGRVDYVRVRLRRTADGLLEAVPILGKSGLIRTMVEADGLVAIEQHSEGLDAGAMVNVRLL